MSGLTRAATSKLVQDVDGLLAWQKSFEHKQREMLAWQAAIEARITELENSLKTTLRGCGLLVDADQVMEKRLDVINKRIRQLENPNG